MSSATQLSTKDRAVLGALFDPEVSLDRAASTTFSSTPESSTPEAPSEITIIEQEAIRLLDTPAPSDQDVYSAIARLTSITTFDPTYASAYVNRAQAYRLLPKALTDASITASIFTDLERAISLATPALEAVKPGLARVLSSAHTHRGYLLLHASTHPSYFAVLQLLELPLLHDIATPAQLEELASRDLSVAGRYGNKTAQQLAVKTNPYAKLCGQIVKEALQREIKKFRPHLDVARIDLLCPLAPFSNVKSLSLCGVRGLTSACFARFLVVIAIKQIARGAFLGRSCLPCFANWESVIPCLCCRIVPAYQEPTHSFLVPIASSFLARSFLAKRQATDRACSAEYITVAPPSYLNRV